MASIDDFQKLDIRSGDVVLLSPDTPVPRGAVVG
jgi:hypothetical protein